MPAAGKIGFRVLPAPPRLAAALIARFQGLGAANLADAMGRFNWMDSGIRMRSGLPLSGVAVTVRARPADNLMVHKALEVAQPGDIVVVNTCGNTGSAVFGELMATSAAAKGLGGIVVDGAIRDVEAITRLKLPAFSRTISPGGCDKDGWGEVNVPISCGGTVVMPGDLVVGDSDGVAVVPRTEAEAVLELVTQLLANEQKRKAEIARGVLFRSEIDAALRQKGVIE
jgi:4-hydroxy-4-methyl-2-oxoglutarate aldolase